MSGNDIALLPVILPLLGAALALCAKAFYHGQAGKPLEYAGAFVGLFLPWLALAWLLPEVLAGEAYGAVIGSWPAALGIVYRFDGLAWLVDALGLSVAGAAWLYSLGAGPRGPAFTAIFLIQTSALAATMATMDLFNLFVCLEVLGMASYVLVVSSEKPGAYLASFSYLMVSAAAMVFFLLGLYGYYRLTGSLSYEGISTGLARLPDGGGTVAAVSLACIAAAVALRVAVMPLYGWLPDAHAMAPHAISAVLSGVLIKTPLFALSRIVLSMPGGGATGQVMGYAGGITALVAVLIALSQKDCKRLLAYHSISQIGYIVAAWGAGISASAAGNHAAGAAFGTAAFLHAFYHALFKGLLFLSVGTTSDAAGIRDVYLLRNANSALRQAGERFPFTLLSFFVGAMSITALPPFNGYASKAALSYVLKGRWEYLFLFAAGIGTMASFIKLSRIFWPAKPTTDGKVGVIEEPVPDSGPGYRITWPVIAAQAYLAVLCIATGLVAPAISAFARTLISGESSAPLPAALYNLSAWKNTALVLVGGILLFLLASTHPGKRIAAAVRNRPRGFHGLFVSFALGLAALSLWLQWQS
ncbi:MAG: proton-conducting transporter membrane subunit [Spirochaetia bacterium]|jgi:multicomponent Na+:H+ antiporter subunit D|nr:proton-conducting transporter membrane subunit [Spirochaetia bacterium]